MILYKLTNKRLLISSELEVNNEALIIFGHVSVALNILCIRQQSGIGWTFLLIQIKLSVTLNSYDPIWRERYLWSLTRINIGNYCQWIRVIFDCLHYFDFDLSYFMEFSIFQWLKIALHKQWTFGGKKKKKKRSQG